LNAVAALKALKVANDFAFTKPESNALIQFAHWKLICGEIYFADTIPDGMNGTFIWGKESILLLPTASSYRFPTHQAADHHAGHRVLYAVSSS
jgi:hypothetical protein